MSSCAAVRFEYCAPDAGRWYDVRAYPSSIGLSFVMADITDRKEADRRQRCLSQLNEMLRRIDDPTEVKWIAASAVGDFLGINSAAYGGVDDREQFLTIDRAYRHVLSGIEWVF